MTSDLGPASPPPSEAEDPSGPGPLLVLAPAAAMATAAAVGSAGGPVVVIATQQPASFLVRGPG
jgi:hypothetical protein